MYEQLGRLGYSLKNTSPRTDLFLAGSLATPAAQYASVDAMLAALNPSVAAQKASYIAFDGDPAQRATRVLLGMSAVNNDSTDGFTAAEDLYLVVALTSDQDDGAMALFKLGGAAWVFGLTNGVHARGVMPAGVDVLAKSVQFTSKALLPVLLGTGIDVAASPASSDILGEAFLAVPDVGNARGILRVIAITGGSPAALGVTPRHHKWK